MPIPPATQYAYINHSDSWDYKFGKQNYYKTEIACKKIFKIITNITLLYGLVWMPL